VTVLANLTSMNGAAPQQPQNPFANQQPQNPFLQQMQAMLQASAAQNAASNRFADAQHSYLNRITGDPESRAAVLMNVKPGESVPPFVPSMSAFLSPVPLPQTQWPPGLLAAIAPPKLRSLL
jgi:hypothetical protein